MTRLHSVAERMEQYIDRTGGPDACWPWVRGRHDFGYGECSVEPDYWVDYPNRRSTKKQRAHILAWEIANNSRVPAGLVVRHACHYPPCCNPSHLSIGTKKDNAQDAVEADRVHFGENHAYAKVSEQQVLAIRELVSQGYEHHEIPVMLNLDITREAVTRIATGKVWRKTANVQKARRKHGEYGKKLTQEKVDEMRSLQDQYSSVELAEMFGVSDVHVRKILEWKVWTGLPFGEGPRSVRGKANGLEWTKSKKE